MLKLELINPGINCHHCQTYTDKLHEDRPILVRDLSIFGQPVYLQVPRRQFECHDCKKTSTERLSFLETRRRYTVRYEEYIYERVKELTVEQVGQTVETLEKHTQEICHDFIQKTTSGVMEGINNKIKLIIRQSYGFNTFDSLREKLLACLFK